jgi:hypothetical protein
MAIETTKVTKINFHKDIQIHDTVIAKNIEAEGDLSINGNSQLGEKTIASGKSSIAEGYNTVSSGYASHAEGHSTSATMEEAHAEGWKTQATNNKATQRVEKRWLVDMEPMPKAT